MADLAVIWQVLSLASQAVEGWETNTSASRMAALQAAKAAAVDAQECNKHTRYTPNPKIRKPPNPIEGSTPCPRLCLPAAMLCECEHSVCSLFLN